jgi:hypothetical protein
MAPALVSIIIVVYFAVLTGLAITTPKGAGSNTFFTAKQRSPWYLAAFGMTGSFFPVSPTIGSAHIAAFRQPMRNQTSLFSTAFILNLPL